MNSRIRAGWRRWHFSVLLLMVYLAAFATWQHMGPGMIRLTGISFSLGLALALVFASARGYFFNGWDRAIHAVVIMDMLLESFFPEHVGFYWCALAFLILIIGYRRVRGRTASSLDRGREVLSIQRVDDDGKDN
jgi:hypothetical protein